MSNHKDRIEYFLCDCGSREHLMVAEIIDWTSPDLPKEYELMFSLQLNHYLPWYKRVWFGIKYIFGIKLQTWYDVVLIQKKDAELLKDLVDDYLRRIGS
jgi:hypothetical protein